MSIDTLADRRYELAELLGSGGMGLVHRAHDTRLGRDVAIKLLADNLAQDADARERFSREARAAARLSHPHVVQVFDVGEEDGRPYLVMELVDGPSLATVLDVEGTLAAGEVITVAEQSLMAVGAAHDAGLLHRDLKPGNLMRAADGTVKVTDFGVAEVAEAPGLTRSGVVLGTLPYLAPERLTGAPATPRTDLYGLGATLLQLLTGQPPSATDGSPGTAALDTVPPPLAMLLHRCLAPDAANRPSSTGEALAILRGQQIAVGSDQRTELLPAMEIATTPLEDEQPAPDAPTHADAPTQPDAPTDPDAPTEAYPARPSGGQRRRSRMALGITALVGLAVVLALLVGGLAGGSGGSSGAVTPPDGGGASTGGASTGGASTGEDNGGLPQVSDPAQQMRELGDWLRQQGG